MKNFKDNVLYVKLKSGVYVNYTKDAIDAINLRSNLIGKIIVVKTRVRDINFRGNKTIVTVDKLEIVLFGDVGKKTVQELDGFENNFMIYFRGIVYLNKNTKRLSMKPLKGNHFVVAKYFLPESMKTCLTSAKLIV